jgi:hypothetical protein
MSAPGEGSASGGSAAPTGAAAPVFALEGGTPPPPAPHTSARNAICTHPAPPRSPHAAVLETIRSAQAQNGLRHSDYSRYARYCARRLRRLRVGTKWSLSANRKFMPRDMRPADVTDVRHFAIMLFSAERAWASAQVMKQVAGTGADMGAVAKHHMLARFKRAAEWSAKLQTLAAARGDARTSLEAEAYACFHMGALSVELEGWDEGLRQFTAARRIYDELSAVAPRRTRQLYTERMVEVQTLERFCKYSLSRGPGGAAAAAAASAAAEAPESAAMRAKYAAARAATMAARFDGVATVYWRASIVPVASDRVRAALAAAAAAAAGGAGGVAEAGRHFAEGARAATAEATAAAREGKDSLAADCRSLSAYCRFSRARLAVEAAAAVAMAEREGGRAGAPAGSNAWEASAYHIALGRARAGAGERSAASRAALKNAESAAAGAAATALGRALKSLSDMAVLLGGPLAVVGWEEGDEGTVLTSLPPLPADADADALACLFARQAFLLAWRAWHCAVAYSGARQYGEAAALLARAQERARAGQSAYAEVRARGAALAAPGPSVLPSVPALPGSPTAERTDVPLVFVLTGVCVAEEAGCAALLELSEARGLVMRSEGLLEALAPSLRADAPLIGLYDAAMAVGRAPGDGAPPPLTRTVGRPAWLTQRASGASLSEPTSDAACISPFPPGLLPVPAKPFLFDLAFKGVAYPAAVQAGAEAASKAATSGEAAAASGPGLLSWLTGR